MFRSCKKAEKPALENKVRPRNSRRDRKTDQNLPPRLPQNGNISIRPESAGETERAKTCTSVPRFRQRTDAGLITGPFNIGCLVSGVFVASGNYGRNWVKSGEI